MQNEEQKIPGSGIHLLSSSFYSICNLRLVQDGLLCSESSKSPALQLCLELGF